MTFQSQVTGNVHVYRVVVTGKLELWNINTTSIFSHPSSLSAYFIFFSSTPPQPSPLSSFPPPSSSFTLLQKCSQNIANEGLQRH